MGAGAPSTAISTLYLPAGQPLFLSMWNSVTAGPVGAIVSLPSLTVCPSWKVHFAVSVLLGAEPVVATEA